MKNGLEVFDFKEEDELPEFAAGKYLAKFRNPNDVVGGDNSHNRNPAALKYDFLECAQGSGVPGKETRSLPCIEVDAIESDRGSGMHVACTPLGLVTEDTGCRDGDCDSGAPCPSASLSHGTRHDSENFSESRSPLAEQEPRASPSSDKAPTLPTSKCNSVVTDSLCTTEPANLKVESDDRMDAVPPSSPNPDIAQDGVSLNSQPSIPCFVGSERDNVQVTVDYVVIRDTYYTGCLVSFSSKGVKINCSDIGEHFGALNFEKSIEDIIRIDSQHLQRFNTVMVRLQVLPENKTQSDQANGISGIEELEFTVIEHDWSKKWEEITATNVNYSALWNVVHGPDVGIDEGNSLLRRKPYYPIFDEAFEDVIYPKGDSDAVSISKRDVDLLQPETFVNDTIIDFYIKYLKNQIPQEEKQRFHFFNSFFFRKLADLDKDPSSASDGRAAFLRVRKWTRKVDLFGKDYIFIPVNFSLHWSLLVLCHLGELASSNELGSPRIPCVLHMDSIKGTHAGLKDLVQSYLWEEWKERHEGTLEDLSKIFTNLRFVPLELPQQENSFDCGLFLLHYLELFLVEAPLNFSPFNINEDNKFLTADWFPPVEASLKRTLIQRLISELLENRSHEVSSTDCSDEEPADCLQNGEKVGAVEFVRENYTATASCQGGLSNSMAGQGIEITLLEASSERNPHCANDPGLVLREFFEPGVAAGSLLAHCSSFGRTNSYYDHNSAMSQMEDDSGDQLMFFASGETSFQQMVNMAPQAGGIPYSFEGFGTDTSWKLRTHIEEEDDKSSLEASACASDDDSDIGIIENHQIGDTNYNQSKKVGEQISQAVEDAGCQQISQAIEDAGCLATGFASASNESVVNKCCEDTEKLHTGDENGDLVEALDEWPDTKENGLEEDTAKATVVPKDGQTTDHDDAITDLDEQVDAGRLSENDDEQQATKRLKLTHSLEVEGGLARSVPEDLHL